jgi:crossover junction endodeoxyribonuclease RuvC
VENQNSNLKYIASGTVSSTTSQTTAERLCGIYQAILDVIAEHQPTEFAIEESFVNNNPLSSLKLGQARAAAILAAGTSNLRIFEYAPRLVKKAVVGSGRADKNQVICMVKYLMPTSTARNEHEADAIAIAICHSNISATYQSMKLS